LHTQCHAHYITGVVSDEQERFGIADVIARPRCLLGSWCQALSSGGVGRKPHSDGGFDVLSLPAPYYHIAHRKPRSPGQGLPIAEETTGNKRHA
jgi:hypothetical protein